MFRDLDLGIATSVVDSVISAACNDYYNIHPNERGPIVTLSEKPAVTRSVFEPTQHLSESFVRYSKDDEITVCDSAVDSILSGALEQYYCLHPEERARPIRLEKQQPIVPELAVAAGQQRRSVDFLTLPLEEVVANEAISGALEEYYRIHGDQRPTLARLSLNNDSNVSNSKRRSSSSVQPGFISPRKTIDEEVVDSVISSALRDYYNLHPNERPRRVSSESTPKSEPQPSRATTNVPMRPRGPIDEEIADSVIQNALAQYYSVHPEARPRNS